MTARSIACAAALAALLPALAAADPLAGTWRAVQDGQALEITLGADGRFARRDGGRDGSAMTVSGRWSVAGHWAGKGDYAGVMEVKAGESADRYAVTLDGAWADGRAEAPPNR